MNFGKGITPALTLACLVAGCGQQAQEQVLPIADEALIAARSGNVEGTRLQSERFRQIELPSCKSGRLRRHQSNAADKLTKIAAFRASKKSSQDAGVLLSAGIARPSIDEAESCDRSDTEREVEAAIAQIDAEAVKVEAIACAIVIANGPAPESAFSVEVGEQRGYSCTGGASKVSQSVVRSYAERQLTGTGIMHLVNPLWCMRGSDEEVNFGREYEADIRALGLPDVISVSKDGVSARWPHGYELVGSRNPNLVRRTLGAYPSIEDIRSMTSTEGEYFSQDAVEQVRGSCLSESEVSRILVNHVNSNSADQ